MMPNIATRSRMGEVCGKVSEKNVFFFVIWNRAFRPAERIESQGSKKCQTKHEKVIAALREGGESETDLSRVQEQQDRRRDFHDENKSHDEGVRGQHALRLLTRTTTSEKGDHKCRQADQDDEDGTCIRCFDDLIPVLGLYQDISSQSHQSCPDRLHYVHVRDVTCWFTG